MRQTKKALPKQSRGGGSAVRADGDQESRDGEEDDDRPSFVRHDVVRDRFENSENPHSFLLPLEPKEVPEH